MRKKITYAIALLVMPFTANAAETLQFEDGVNGDGYYFTASGRCYDSNILNPKETWHAKGPVSGGYSGYSAYIYGPQGVYRTVMSRVDSSDSVAYWARVVCGEKEWESQLESTRVGEFKPAE